MSEAEQAIELRSTSRRKIFSIWALWLAYAFFWSYSELLKEGSRTDKILLRARPSLSFSTQKSLLNINLASSEELEELPKVGPVLAERIVAWRLAHGKFVHLDDLKEVKGIGEEKLKKILPEIEL